MRRRKNYHVYLSNYKISAMFVSLSLITPYVSLFSVLNWMMVSK